MGDRPVVVWFRRDLRIHDHPALAAAVRTGAPVVPLFVFDPRLLHGRFASPNRTWFLLGCVTALRHQLERRGATLVIRIVEPADVVPAIAQDTAAAEVYVSRDLTPYGRARDRAVVARLDSSGVVFRAKPGLLIHEPESLLSRAGGPFQVFSPFYRAWQHLPLRDVLQAPGSIRTPTIEAGRIPAPTDLGIDGPTADAGALPDPGEQAARERMSSWLAGDGGRGIEAYPRERDRLANQRATSRLSADLRFGTISAVEAAARARSSADGEGLRRWISELAWRDFYAHILWHEPRVAREPFLERFAAVVWEPDDDTFAAWQAGRTGYPVVDAAMRQLLATGYMPNRARMIVASFLTKDLLVDWRAGEAHFMRHLVDGDPASNLGGWQWAASVGTDAQPYFRIFNPVTQGERFDPDGEYVRRWVPELAAVPAGRIHCPWTMPPDEQRAAGVRIGVDYPGPIVDHAEARLRAIARLSLAADPFGR
jgi:deoxyribodipyrimidine photo-lyase